MKKITSVFEYLEKLSNDEFTELYGSEFTCLSVYKSLTLLGQYLVRSMLNGNERWTLEEFKQCLKQNNDQSIAECVRALARMQKLRILFESGDQNRVGTRTFSLGRTFKNGLSQALKELPLLESSRDHDYSEHKLQKYAKRKWEKLLNYMVVDNEDIYNDSSDVLIKELIKSAELVQLDDNDEVQITSEGFQFLLLDLRSQIWTLLQEYMTKSELISRVKRVDILDFLFLLSFLKVGKGYFCKKLDKTQQQLVRDLSNFGLVRKKNDMFHVTPLANEFCGGGGEGGESSGTQWTIPGLHGQIITETNFKIFAYTKSEIQIGMLSLFSKMILRCANLVVGIIDRDSVRGALVNGITADQIIGYLWMHAHSKSLENEKGPVPLNVINQVRLWEKERNRIKQTKAIFLDSFTSANEYNQTLDFAKKKGWMLWANPQKMWLVLKGDKEGVEKSINNFIVYIQRKASNPQSSLL